MPLRFLCSDLFASNLKSAEGALFCFLRLSFWVPETGETELLDDLCLSILSPFGDFELLEDLFEWGLLCLSFYRCLSDVLA